MTDERNITEQLSAYLDGELSDAEAGRIELAVAGDEKLAADLESLRATRELLRGLPREKAPADMADRVLTHAERGQLMRKSPTRRQPGPMRWARFAAAAAVLIVAGGLVALMVHAMYLPDAWDGAGQTAHDGTNGGAGVHPPTEIAAKSGDGDEEGKAGEIGGNKVASGDKTGRRPPRARWGKGGEPHGVGRSPLAKARTPDRHDGSDVRVESFLEQIEAPSNAVNLEVVDMVLGQQDVEAFLIENGIRPLRTTDPTPDPETTMSRRNFYFNQRLNGSEQYVAFVPAGEVEQYRLELTRRVVASQVARRSREGEPSGPPVTCAGGEGRAETTTDIGSAEHPEPEESARSEARGAAKLADDGEKTDDQWSEELLAAAEGMNEALPEPPSPNEQEAPGAAAPPTAVEEAEAADADGAARTGELPAEEPPRPAGGEAAPTEPVAEDAPGESSPADGGTDPKDEPDAALHRDGSRQGEGAPASEDGHRDGTEREKASVHEKATQAEADLPESVPSEADNGGISGGYGSESDTRPAEDAQREPAAGAEDAGTRPARITAGVSALPGGQAAVDELRRQLTEIGADVELLVITLDAVRPEEATPERLLEQMRAAESEVQIRESNAAQADPSTAPPPELDAAPTTAPAGE